MCAMRSEGRGRPRLEQSRRPGKNAREEILDAAAELFTTHGYANTSTRRIADAVGVRQASLYHHFATKDDILDALLAGTVDEPLQLAAELIAEEGPAAPAPARTGGGRRDAAVRQHLESRRALPASRTAGGPLRASSACAAPSCATATAGWPRPSSPNATVRADADELPFRLVESVINRRSDDGGAPAEQPWIIADGALRTLGFDGDFAALREATAKRLALHIGALT